MGGTQAKTLMPPSTFWALWGDGWVGGWVGWGRLGGAWAPGVGHGYPYIQTLKMIPSSH